MELYVDDMLVKSLKTKDHVKHLDIIFQILKRNKMMLNLLSRYLVLPSEKFLGYMVNQRGIKANFEKIKTLIEMRYSKKA